VPASSGTEAMDDTIVRFMYPYTDTSPKFWKFTPYVRLIALESFSAGHQRIDFMREVGCFIPGWFCCSRIWKKYCNIILYVHHKCLNLQVFLRFDSRRGLGIFLFITVSRTALGPTQPPIQWVPGDLSLGGKEAGT